MPHTITDARGQEVEVLTTEDLSRAAWQIIRWFGGTGIVALVAGAIMWANLNNRVEQVEVLAKSNRAAATAETQEIRALTRKVDSLVYVAGTQTELLREIRQRVR